MKRILIAIIIFCSWASIAQVSVPRYELITATGTDTYAATLTPTPSLTNGYKFMVKFTNANTGASTLNVNSLGAVTLRKHDGTALSSGDIAAGSDWWAVYDGTASQWRLMGGGSSATGITDINGQTGTAQIITTDGTGTDVGVSSSTDTHTIHLPTASATNRGVLSTADWSTFNGKQSAITFGTGVQTALGVNIGSAGAPVLFNGALGTPSSGTLTNATGLPVSTGISGLGSGVATWLATPSWTNFSAAITGTSPYLTTANPAYTGTLTTGTLGFSDTDIGASYQKSVNSYFQSVWQNTNSGATASIDLVMASDNATASTHYLNLGRNSSGFTGSGSLNGAGYGYLTNTSEDLVIGTTTAHSLRFLTNSATTDNLSISSTGVFAFNSPVQSSTWTNTWTASASGQAGLRFSGTQTSRSNAADIVYGVLDVNNTVDMAATNQQFGYGASFRTTFTGGNSTDILGGVLISTTFSGTSGDQFPLTIKRADSGPSSVRIINSSTGNASINMTAVSGADESTTSGSTLISRTNGTNGNLTIRQTGTGGVLWTLGGVDVIRFSYTGNAVFGSGSAATAMLQAKGAGTTTGELFRLDDSGSTNRDLALDNGTRTFTGPTFSFVGRMRQTQGADVASVAGAIALGTDGNAFEITGTNAITLISNTNWQNGSVITLLFTSTATLTDGTANSGTDIGMELAGNANFVASADDVITLILSEIGGTQRWREVSRSVN